MRFAVGYQLPEEGEEPLVEIVRDFRDRIEEVYFPWLDMPSGRSPMSAREGFVDWGAQERLEADLRAFRQMGVRLDLLLNANCYGGEGLSQALAHRICSLIDHLGSSVGLDTVTTCSLFVARTVRQHFPAIDVRASINMRIGTVRGLEYVADLFTSYNLQREHNRDLERIAEVRAWAEAHGKGLHFLVNSGCLSFCSGQVFHDNLVAHEAEIGCRANVEGWNPSQCWNYLADRRHWPALLQATWVRPEDLRRYEGLFPVAKLATRMHADPRRVVRAYCEGRYRGNLLDLFEPSHAPLLMPHIIDNMRFPADWFERTTTCGRRCEGCGYCEAVLEEVLVTCEV
jgi:collagenase-like PrtC family protease